MAKYIVKTINDRNQVIEADMFPLYRSSTHSYEFYKGGNLAASVPQANVFAIVEWDADLNDYYLSDHEIDDNFNANFSEFDHGPGDEELNEELFDSQEFFNAVADIFYVLTKPDEEESNPPEPTIPKVEKRIGEYGTEEYGFVTPQGWVGFSNKEYAESGARQYFEGYHGWSYIPIEKTQVIQ